MPTQGWSDHCSTLRSAAVAARRHATRLRPQAARDALDDDDGSFRLLFAACRRKQYEALSIPEKRAALASLIERVELKPGRGTSSERLTIHFTDGAVHPAPEGIGAPVAVKVAA